MPDPDKLRVAIQALVQVDLNRSKYDTAKETSPPDHVNALKCKRASLAAYWFEPSVEYSLDDVVSRVEFLRNPSGMDKHRVDEGTTAQLKKAVKIDEIVSKYRKENSKGETIQFGENCGTDDKQLREQFKKQSIQNLGRPTNKCEDNLGLAERFRIREATLNQLSTDLTFASSELFKTPLTDEEQQSLPTAISKEKQRLRDDLKKVRAKMVEVTKAEWAKASRQLGIGDGVDTSGVMKKVRVAANFEGDKAEFAAKLIDLHRLFERLSATAT